MEQIWDPLRKKQVTATPEEQVRQWFILYLMDNGVPAHMMMSEVGFKFGRKAYRADIVVYGRDMEPLAVVECKRPEVDLGPAVLEQAMRYNSVLGVKFLFVTNGKKTYLYRLEEGRFVPLGQMPSYGQMLCLQ